MRSEPVLPLQTALIGGYAMSYTEYGSGAPLVLVHGSLSDCRYWKSQMAPLGRSFRVLAVCLRRYWPETWDGEGEGFSIDQHASDVLEFIDTVAGGPAHLDTARLFRPTAASPWKRRCASPMPCAA